MIEKETMLTVFGVILLGISYGLSSSYILKNDMETLTGSALPFAMNMAVFIYITFGLYSVSKLSGSILSIILIGLVLMSYIEISMMYDKPSSWYGISSAWVAVTVSTVIRLYLIISLNCDFAKSIFVVAARSIVDPGKVMPVIAETKVDGNWDKAFSTFEAALRRIPDLTADERVEQINKFRLARGLPPKEVSLKGGKR
jgi:hypothetical protein